jgi:hypothetical protein
MRDNHAPALGSGVEGFELGTGNVAEVEFVKRGLSVQNPGITHL